MKTEVANYTCKSIINSTNHMPIVKMAKSVHGFSWLEKIELHFHNIG